MIDIINEITLFIIRNPIEWTVLIAIVMMVVGAGLESVLHLLHNNMYDCEECDTSFLYSNDKISQSGFIMCSKCWDKEVTTEYNRGRNDKLDYLAGIKKTITEG